MEANDNLYKKGFNSGYLIAQHEPKIWGIIKGDKTPNHDNPYLNGLKAGGKQYEQDKTQTRLNKLVPKKAAEQNQPKAKGKGR